MDHQKVYKKYEKLKKKLDKKKLGQDHFYAEVEKLRVQDGEGLWWQIDPDEGFWLKWNGQDWERAAPPGFENTAMQDGFPPPGQNEPQSLFQLISLLFKGIIKSAPKMLLRAALIGIIVWFAHAYLLVVINNGYLKVQFPDRMVHMVLALDFPDYSGYNNVAGATLFWTIAGWLASFVFFNRIIGQGPLKYGKDLAYTPLFIAQGFERLKPGKYGYLLVFISLGIVASLLLNNVPVVAIIGLAFLVGLTARFDGLSIMFLKVIYLDLQRLFRRGQQLQRLNENYLVLIYCAIFASALLVIIFPYKPYSLYLAAGLFFGIGILLVFQPKLSSPVLFASFYLGVTLAFLFLNEVVFAHDGGLPESNNNLRIWWGSGGRAPALAAGNVPAAGGFFGGLFGALSGAASSLAQTASGAVSRVSDAVSGTYQTVKENVSYGAEVLGGTFINIVVDVAELCGAVKQGLNAAWEGTKYVAGSAADAAKSAWNDPWGAAYTTGEFIFGSYGGSRGLIGHIGDAIVSGGQSAAELGSYIWNNPLEAAGRVASGAYDIASTVGNAIYTTVTDPRKAWDFVKETTGINDLLVHALDPNKSLLERIGHVGMGTMKVGLTALTLGKASAFVAKTSLGKTVAAKAVGVKAKAKSAYQSAKAALTEAKRSFTKLDGAGRSYVAKGPANTRFIPKRTIDALNKVSAQEGVNIYGRYGNKASRRLIEMEISDPKAVFIKNKTINAYDVLLGAKRQNMGKVGHFYPKKPNEALLRRLKPQHRRELLKQYTSRVKEYTANNGKLHSMKGQVSIGDGVLHNPKTGRSFAGDLDILDIRDAKTGLPVSHAKHDQVIRSLQQNGATVEHGALTEWSSRSDFNKKAFDSMMNAIREGGEGAVSFGPGQKPLHVILTGP